MELFYFCSTFAILLFSDLLSFVGRPFLRECGNVTFYVGYLCTSIVCR